ncbi:hypothetical protein, partial [Roseiarcus sp.]|uniref:hypothetical protein n=1 Tax=Roseiarcus sp. TaxID=1969460 RepID=UPI003D0A101F
MGVSGRDWPPVSVFMGLVLLLSPMIGRALAADAQQSSSAATRPAVGKPAPLDRKTFTPARAWRVAFARGPSSVVRDAKTDSL